MILMETFRATFLPKMFLFILHFNITPDNRTLKIPYDLPEDTEK